MRAFGSPTPKRTTLWSNSSGIRYFCTSKKARGKSKGPKLADTYIDKAGKKRYKGNGNLRKSQFQPHWFMTVIIPMALSVYVCEYLEYCTMMAPVGFGVRFAEHMNHLRKERFPLPAQHVPSCINYGLFEYSWMLFLQTIPCSSRVAP